MRVVNGDLLESKENIIVQQVNHKGKMGAGLAKQIRTLYPNIYPNYVTICETIPFEQIRASGYVYYYVVSPTQRIASVFGQDGYGRGKRYTDYRALRNGLLSVASLASSQNMTVGIPYGLGCGLAGGDWNTVNGILKEVFDGLPMTIYKLG